MKGAAERGVVLAAFGVAIVAAGGVYWTFRGGLLAPSRRRAPRAARTLDDEGGRRSKRARVLRFPRYLMSANPARWAVDFAEYLRFEREAAERHELIEGEIVAMAGRVA